MRIQVSSQILKATSETDSASGKVPEHVLQLFNFKQFIYITEENTVLSFKKIYITATKNNFQIKRMGHLFIHSRNPYFKHFFSFFIDYQEKEGAIY